MKIIKNGCVTTPIGFKAGGYACGIKKEGLDLGMIYSEVPSDTAIMATTNIVKAAPIVWCKNVMINHMKQAVIVNSGNANACTGEQGMNNVLSTV